MTTYAHTLIIPHPDGKRVLLLPDGAAYRLPHFEREKPAFWQDVSHVNAWAETALGLAVTTLRCLSTSAENGRIHNVYAMENHAPAWVPPEGALWATEADVREVIFSRDYERPMVERWFGWAVHSPPNGNAPWYRPGWYTRAAAWFTETLSHKGITPQGAPEQVRTWGRSAILRVPTDEGLMYFKAVPPFFAHEIQLNKLLHAWFPEYALQPTAVDTGRRWVITRDFGDSVLYGNKDIRVWEGAVRAYADLQIRVAAHKTALLSMGCPLRSPEVIGHELKKLLADEEPLRVGQLGLSKDEIEALRGHLPQIYAMLTDLTAVGLPLTLEHGDFHSANVVLQGEGERFVFFDWSDSSMAHPFFSLPFFLSEIHRELPDVPDAATRLRDAYLEPWEQFAGRGELLHAYDLAEKLAGFHGALLYHRIILPGLPVRWEMANMLPYHLRISLAKLDLKKGPPL